MPAEVVVAVVAVVAVAVAKTNLIHRSIETLPECPGGASSSWHKSLNLKAMR
jgi:hypothetical protein